jgi:hypothetical protein
MPSDDGRDGPSATPVRNLKRRADSLAAGGAAVVPQLSRSSRIPAQISVPTRAVPESVDSESDESAAEEKKESRIYSPTSSRIYSPVMNDMSWFDGGDAMSPVEEDGHAAAATAATPARIPIERRPTVVAPSITTAVQSPVGVTTPSSATKRAKIEVDEGLLPPLKFDRYRPIFQMNQEGDLLLGEVVKASTEVELVVRRVFPKGKGKKNHAVIALFLSISDASAGANVERLKQLSQPFILPRELIGPNRTLDGAPDVHWGEFVAKLCSASFQRILFLTALWNKEKRDRVRLQLFYSREQFRAQDDINAAAAPEMEADGTWPRTIPNIMHSRATNAAMARSKK